MTVRKISVPILFFVVCISFLYGMVILSIPVMGETTQTETIILTDNTQTTDEVYAFKVVTSEQQVHVLWDEGDVFLS